MENKEELGIDSVSGIVENCPNWRLFELISRLSHLISKLSVIEKNLIEI